MTITECSYPLGWDQPKGCLDSSTWGDVKAVYMPVKSKMLVFLNADAKTLSTGFPSPSLLTAPLTSSPTWIQDVPRLVLGFLSKKKLSASMKWWCMVGPSAFVYGRETRRSKTWSQCSSHCTSLAMGSCHTLITSFGSDETDTRLWTILSPLKLAPHTSLHHSRRHGRTHWRSALL